MTPLRRRPAPQTPRQGVKEPLQAADVAAAQWEAAKRGGLVLWTVYDKPKDYPQGFIARMHEIRPGADPRPTDTTIKASNIDAIRRILSDAGLIKLTRCEGDDKTIVESWV